MAMDPAQVVAEVLAILDETVEHHHGIYLDKGTSLLETLRTIDHRQASIPVGGGCASLAAQVAHVTFYMEIVERDLVGGDDTKADWDEIWRTVEAVDVPEWDHLRDALEQTYRRVLAQLRADDEWETAPHLQVALAIAVHTAYHLGEIRQALCALPPRG